MATIVTPATTVMRPYSHGGPIAYDRLDYNPDEPVLKPDATQQNLQLEALLVLLRAHFTDFNRRPDVFLDFNTILCYDPRDLNVRVSPDVYLAFGVDARAIRSRKLYLPWEAGKPPDWALEIASSSTGGVDTGRKREIYARIGVPEYWRFDPTAAGEYHGTRLAGERLVGGVYRPLPLTREPDGILKGYSLVLRLSLCWDNGWPRLYDPGHRHLPGDLAGGGSRARGRRVPGGGRASGPPDCRKPCCPRAGRARGRRGAHPATGGRITPPSSGPVVRSSGPPMAPPATQGDGVRRGVRGRGGGWFLMRLRGCRGRCGGRASRVCAGGARRCSR